MESMREAWTDERMDDLSRHMDAGFARIDADFTRIDADIRELRTEMGAFHRTILQLGAGTIVTFAIGFAGLIITQL
jgi:uncharacterized membrane protein (Fun14 family)